MSMFILADILPRNVILTDDPMRAEMLVAHHLDNARLVSETRGLRCYAGTYKDVPLAVAACGFGTSAAMLCLKEAYELGAGNAVYIGECITLSGRYSLMDIIVPKGSDAKLTRNIKAAANAKKAALHLADVHTDDEFPLSRVAPDGCDIIDFAHEGLCGIAVKFGLEMASLLVVSEDARTGGRIDESVRQSGFHTAAQLAFETLASGVES